MMTKVLNCNEVEVICFIICNEVEVKVRNICNEVEAKEQESVSCHPVPVTVDLPETHGPV
jgi:hypothetical protein